MTTWGTDGRESRGVWVLMGSCAVVATSAYLGADWLRASFLSLPTGLWMIGMVQGAYWARQRTLSASETPKTSESFSIIEWGPGSMAGRACAAAWEAVRAGAGAVHLRGERFRELEDRIAARFEGTLTRARPLRIGLDAGPETRQAITSQRTQVPVEWVTLSPSADDQVLMKRLRLDAIFRQPSLGPARIVTLEYPEREAAWYDWSQPRPLTYASVFPVRVDATQVTLDGFDAKDAMQAGIVAGTLRAAAALSRFPARLRLSDRLTGRLPSAGGALGSGVRTPTGLADRAMLELTEIVNAATPSAAAKPGARAVSAWLASTDAWLDINLRREGVESALRLVGEEPELLLRAAAVRLATVDDEPAYEALRRAEAIIRAGDHEQVGEHLAFLQAELELGLPNPLTLGRVASGICMVCASSPRDRVAYVRGDIMDDVRHSAWLVGRDQDRAVLGEVFRQMGADRVGPGPWELRDAA